MRLAAVAIALLVLVVAPGCPGCPGRTHRANDAGIAGPAFGGGVMTSFNNANYCCVSPDVCAAPGGSPGPVPCINPDRPICDEQQRRCVLDPLATVCNDSSDCTNPDRPVCLDGLLKRKCRQCDSPARCQASAPVCDVTNTCGACKRHFECEAYPTTPRCDTVSGGCVPWDSADSTVTVDSWDFDLPLDEAASVYVRKAVATVGETAFLVTETRLSTLDEKPSRHLLRVHSRRRGGDQQTLSFPVTDLVEQSITAAGRDTVLSAWLRETGKGWRLELLVVSQDGVVQRTEGKVVLPDGGSPGLFRTMFLARVAAGWVLCVQARKRGPKGKDPTGELYAEVWCTGLGGISLAAASWHRVATGNPAALVGDGDGAILLVFDGLPFGVHAGDVVAVLLDRAGEVAGTRSVATLDDVKLGVSTSEGVLVTGTQAGQRFAFLIDHEHEVHSIADPGIGPFGGALRLGDTTLLADGTGVSRWFPTAAGAPGVPVPPATWAHWPGYGIQGPDQVIVSETGALIFGRTARLSATSLRVTVVRPTGMPTAWPTAWP